MQARDGGGVSIKKELFLVYVSDSEFFLHDFMKFEFVWVNYDFHSNDLRVDSFSISEFSSSVMHWIFARETIKNQFHLFAISNRLPTPPNEALPQRESHSWIDTDHAQFYWKWSL